MSCIPPRGFTYDSTASSPTTAPYKRPPSVSGRSRPKSFTCQLTPLGRALPSRGRKLSRSGRDLPDTEGGRLYGTVGGEDAVLSEVNPRGGIQDMNGQAEAGDAHTPDEFYRPVDTGQSFPELEERILERWKERRIFQKAVKAREGAPEWVFYEGPPTANGKPGSHHVLARIFKDIYPRFRTMRGYHVARKGGWDCHGLPVELEIEKRLNINHKEEIEDYGIAEFNRLCKESVTEYVDEWQRMTDRIGFWIDMDDAYWTMSDDYIESVWWILSQFWKKGLLTKDHKVVPYCPRCGTALSSHELAQGYEQVTDPAIFVRFPLLDQVGEPEPNTSLLIWRLVLGSGSPSWSNRGKRTKMAGSVTCSYPCANSCEDKAVPHRGQ